jgi:hypothetical protein
MLFGVCEVGIIDDENKFASLINIVNGVNVPRGYMDGASPFVQLQQSGENGIGEGEPIYLAPMKWSAIACWHPLAGDELRVYEQRVEVLEHSSGRVIASGVSTFRFDAKKNHTARAQGPGIPISKLGDPVIRLSLRDVTDDPIAEWSNHADWPLYVSYID